MLFVLEEMLDLTIPFIISSLVCSRRCSYTVTIALLSFQDSLSASTRIFTGEGRHVTSKIQTLKFRVSKSVHVLSIGKMDLYMESLPMQACLRGRHGIL